MLSTFGSTLKTLRIKNKFTQKELSSLTGFGQNTISQHERGTRNMREQDIEIYSKALGINTKKFLSVFINSNETLKNRRLELKLTLEDVGKIVGVGKSTISKWENGDIKNMGKDNIVAYSKALRISPITILDPNNELFDKTIEETSNIMNKLIPSRRSVVKEYAIQQLNNQNNSINIAETY